MAKFTYNEPTNRDDLTDVITNISPSQFLISFLSVPECFYRVCVINGVLS